MSNQGWITDRLPWSVDSDIMGKVWIFDDNAVYWSDYSVVTAGTPWMPIKQPAPYVKPKRWVTRWDVNAHRWYVVDSRDRYIVASLQLDKDHAGAAQRIADIYNEVLP